MKTQDLIRAISSTNQVLVGTITEIDTENEMVTILVNDRETVLLNEQITDNFGQQDAEAFLTANPQVLNNIQ